MLVLSTTLSDYEDAEDVRASFAGDFTGLFILLLGAMGMAGEWRHRTITSTVLAAPDRLRLIAAKTISYAVAGVVVSFIMTALLMLVGTIILSARDQATLDMATLVDMMWRNLVVSAYLGALGVCVGAIVRSQVGVIIGLLLFSLRHRVHDVRVGARRRQVLAGQRRAVRRRSTSASTTARRSSSIPASRRS